MNLSQSLTKINRLLITKRKTRTKRESMRLVWLRKNLRKKRRGCASSSRLRS